MSSRAQPLRGLLVLSLALSLVARAGAQLAAKSPFLSAQAAGNAAPTAGAPLEYRGMMQTSEGMKVRIVDPSRKNLGVWLLANQHDTTFDAVVKQIDVEHDTVTIDYQGRAMTLAQHVAKVSSAGAAQNFPPGMTNPASNMPQAITQSVVVNPTPADEQRRLEAVAAEVARRRQLREQASQQVAQGVPIAPQVIQQQQALRVQQQAQNANLQNQQNNGNNNLRQQRGTGNQGNQRPRGNQP